MKRIYIAGKINGLPMAEARRNFELSAAHTKRMHTTDPYRIYRPECVTVNPFDLKPFLSLENWYCRMITDIRILRHCTHIAMQQNWIHSKGAVIEYFFAKFVYKIEIIFL